MASAGGSHPFHADSTTAAPSRRYWIAHYADRHCLTR
jgi:hypothetical protein